MHEISQMGKIPMNEKKSIFERDFWWKFIKEWKVLVSLGLIERENENYFHLHKNEIQLKWD